MAALATAIVAGVVLLAATGWYSIAQAAVAGAVAMVAVSLATRPPSEETLEKFFPTFTK